MGNNPVNYIDLMGLQRQFKQPKSSAHCQAILKKISSHPKELYDKRWPDLIANKQGLPERIGPGEKLSQTVRGHRTLIDKHDSQLRKWEERYFDECYDDDDHDNNIDNCTKNSSSAMPLFFITPKFKKRNWNGCTTTVAIRNS